ncbi:MAG: hypothetical protein V4577_26885, partial [Bacteroidota bacterium]
MRKYAIAILLLAIAACKTPQQKWFDSLTGYKEIKGKSLVIQLMRIQEKKDTTTLNYKLRIYPVKEWMEQASADDLNHLNYQMDSCFTLKAGAVKRAPAFVQSVASGIKGGFEYLVSFELDSTVKMKALQLTFADRYIGGLAYNFDLTSNSR